MPKVWHVNDPNCPTDAVYIGRPRKGQPNKWGNRFIIGVHGNRRQVIQMHRNSLTPEDIEHIKLELRGRDLKCFCAPNACHGDTYLEIANQPIDGGRE